MFSNTTGTNNIAIGASALNANNGSYNIAIGANSQARTVSGELNITLGREAGAFNKTGDGNICIGAYTLQNASAAYNNIAIGYQSLYTLGAAAPPNTQNSYNIAIGYEAGYNLYTGSGNVFIGGYKGIGLHNNSVFLSDNNLGTLKLSIDQNNAATFYGDVTIPSGSNFTVDSTTLFVDGGNNRVGIGTVSPASALHVVGGLYATGNSNIGGTVIVGGNATFNSNVILGTSSATTEVRSQAIYDTLTSNPATVQIAAAGNSYRLQRSTASSRKWKHDIKDMPSILQDILSLRPVTFKYNLDYLPSTDNRFNTEVYGLIAEEVADVIPVAADYDEGKPSDWNFRILVPILIKAIQEQQKQIQELSDKIDALGDSNG